MGAQPGKRRQPGSVHGVLLIDKPQGLTSFDIVARCRKIYGTRRVGHAGTLDPMATGVLVILLGEATKLSSVLSADVKQYEATVQFGSSTDSLDADGKVTRRAVLEPGWCDEERLAKALQAERERTLQLPPVVSAIKVDGQRSYDLARKGKARELAPRSVAVKQLEVLARDEYSASFRALVTKGYYVRSFARDVGEALGVPSHLSALRRTRSGEFSIDSAVGWPLEGPEPLLSVSEAARRSLPTLELNEAAAQRLRQGKFIERSQILGPVPAPRPELLAAFYSGILVALVSPHESDEFRVKRGINLPSELAGACGSREDSGK